MASHCPVGSEVEEVHGSPMSGVYLISGQLCRLIISMAFYLLVNGLQRLVAAWVLSSSIRGSKHVDREQGCKAPMPLQ